MTQLGAWLLLSLVPCGAERVTTLYPILSETRCEDGVAVDAPEPDPRTCLGCTKSRHVNNQWTLVYPQTDPCFEACLATRYCNYVDVTAYAEAVCRFFSSCKKQSTGDFKDKVYVRENETENVYPYCVTLRSNLEAFLKKYPDLNREPAEMREIIEREGNNLLRPRSEKDYACWFQHLKQSGSSIVIGQGYGADGGGLSAGIQRTTVTNDASNLDQVTKSPVRSSEHVTHLRAFGDLARVLRWLEKSGSRTPGLLPAIPRVLDFWPLPDIPRALDQSAMKMERIYPCFASWLDPWNGLQTKASSLEPEGSLSSVDYWVNFEEKAAAGEVLTASQEEYRSFYTWLKKITGSEEPIKDIAYAKGIMDATFDCITGLHYGEKPTAFLGRDLKMKVKLFAIDFGGTQMLGTFEWCANGALSRLPGSERGAIGYFPMKQRRVEADYFAGYNDVLRYVAELRK